MNDLLTHIKNLNAKSILWVAENPANRFAGIFVEELEHWMSMGISTVEQFEKYNLSMEIYDLHKTVYGFRPNYARLKSLSLNELETELDHLRRAWEIERKNRAVQNRIMRKLRHAQHVAWEVKKKSLLSPKSGFTVAELIEA